MKKIFLSLLLLFCAALLAGCVSAQATYTLADDYTVHINYSLSFDPGHQDASAYISDIGAYWAEQGFSIFADNEAATLTGEKTFACESAQDAAKAFSQLFTDEQTIFSNVSFDYTPGFETDAYSLYAEVSLVDIIRQREAQDIPTEQAEALEQPVSDDAYRISVALPGQVISTNADRQDDGTCTWVLKYGEVTKISLKTQRLNTEKLAERDRLENKQTLEGTLMIACIVVAALCVGTIAVTLIVRRIRRKRASKVRIKHFR